MIESVQARQLGSKDFSTIYGQLCALQDTCPLTSVKAHLKEGSLEVNVDRIRLPDWPPILGSLRINKTLRNVSLRGYFQKPVREDGKPSAKRLAQKAPPVYSKDVTYKMCTALKECLHTTEALTTLTLQGIPLRCYDMQNLSKGISVTTTLQHLSLEYCRLSHRGIEVLCKAVQSSSSLKSINLTGCGVTAKGTEALARLIKHQSTARHSEAWKDSLRYRRPNLEQMPGLRRITLNNNPLINDAGALSMADALKDDLWLKALDLQHCGVSNVGASAILEALRGNSTIVVLDLRRNPLIDHSLLKDIIEQVLINADGNEETEYPWQIASSAEPPGKPKPVRRKSKTRKKEQKPSPARDKNEAKSRVTVQMEQKRVTRPGPGFIPWRSAARAEERQRSATTIPEQGPPMVASHKVPGPVRTASVVHVHHTSQKGPPKTTVGSSVLVQESPTSSSSEDETTTKNETATSILNWRITEQQEKERKEMRVRTEELERRLSLESAARMTAESQVLELTMENSRLKRHLEILSGRHVGINGTSRNGGSLEDLDEDLLKTIEESFKKFHSFLDLLRDAGLGQLCSLVGLAPSELQSPAVATILQNHQPSQSVSHSNEDGMSGDSEHVHSAPGYLAWYEGKPAQFRENWRNGAPPVGYDVQSPPSGFEVDGHRRHQVPQNLDQSLPGYNHPHSTEQTGSQAVANGSGPASSHKQTVDHGAAMHRVRKLNHDQDTGRVQTVNHDSTANRGQTMDHDSRTHRLQTVDNHRAPYRSEIMDRDEVAPTGGFLPDEHISVFAPATVTNVTSSSDITFLPRSRDHIPMSVENKTDHQSRHVVFTQHLMLTKSGTAPPVTAHSLGSGSGPSTTIHNTGSGPIPSTTAYHTGTGQPTNAYYPGRGSTANHHITTHIGDPPPGVATRVAYLATDSRNHSESLSHHGQPASKPEEALSSESHVTEPTVIEGALLQPDQVPEERGRDLTPGSITTQRKSGVTGGFKEDLERKIKLLTVEDRDDDQNGRYHENERNRNNNSSSVYLEEMADKGHVSGGLITPDDLRMGRRTSENTSFHALEPQDATMPGVSRVEEEPEAGAAYSEDDDFDSSRLTSHSGVRTSTPERTLSDLSGGVGETFNKSGELISNVGDDGGVASISEFSSPEQAPIHDSNAS